MLCDEAKLQCVKIKRKQINWNKDFFLNGKLSDETKRSLLMLWDKYCSDVNAGLGEPLMTSPTSVFSLCHSAELRQVEKSC